MSHFTVMVFTKPGQSVEELLAPFDEDLATEFTDDDESDVDDRTGRRGYWHNPQAKWDWWTVGGRWSGQLLRLDGERCDSARIEELDLDTVREVARVKAADTLRQLDAVIAEHGPPPSREWADWFREEGRQEEAKAARDAYWEHPAVQAVSGYGPDSLGLDFEDLEWIERTRDGWVEGKAAAAVCGWAVLTHEGIWMEQGSMSWFGMSDATVDSTVGYLEAASVYLAQVPRDYTVTVIDCHI